MNYAKEDGCSSATLQQKGGRAAGNETVSVPMDADLKKALDAALEAQRALRRWDKATDGGGIYGLRFVEIEECADKLLDAAHDLLSLWALKYLLEVPN